MADLGIALQKRFEQDPDPDDLEESITMFERAVASTPKHHPDKRVRTHILGTCLIRRYEGLGSLDDLSRAISSYEAALQLLPESDPRGFAVLNDLGTALSHRFRKLRHSQDLDQSLLVLAKALQLLPERHETRSLVLTNLGSGFLDRYERQGDVNDIQNSVQMLQDAVRCTPEGDSEKPFRLHMLGDSLLRRYNRTNDRKDLKKARLALQEAVQFTPDGDPAKPKRMGNLGASFLEHSDEMDNTESIRNAISIFEQAVHLTPSASKYGILEEFGRALSIHFGSTGDLNAINKAVSILREAKNLIPENHKAKASILDALGNSLQRRFEQLNDLADLSESVSLLEEAMELTPKDDEARSWSLNNLGGALCRRFERHGDLSDINKSVLLLEEAIRLTPDGHPKKSQLLSNLGHSLKRRFDRLGDVGDINKSVSIFHDPIQNTPDNHPDKVFLLNNLGISLSAWFNRLGELKDINDSITSHEEAMRLTPKNLPAKPAQLSNLGICLLDRYERLKDPKDLDKSIFILDTAVQTISDDHPEKSSLIRNLGNAMYHRFQQQDNLDDLNKCISLFEQAVRLTPNVHPDKPSRLNNQAEALSLRISRLLDPDDFSELLGLYISAATSAVGPASERFAAAERLAHYAQNQHLSDQSEALSQMALLAYEIALRLLPEVAWLGLSIKDRHHQILTAGRLVRDAVAGAISAGQFDQAVEWLEQGRSVVWGQLLNLRTPVEALKETHSDLADRLLFLSSQLEGAGTREGDAQRYHDFADERNRLLDQIRALEGFDRFLLPKEIGELASAGQRGPVVALNISRLRCDALIIRGPGHEILHVPLSDFSLKDAETLAESMATLVGGGGRNVRLYGKREGSIGTEKQFENILSALWMRVVKPVLHALGMIIPLKTTSQRIWWCPTGPLVFLPIHAAGLYGENDPFGSTLADYAISSYTPSLTGLIQGFRPRLTTKSQLLAVAQPSAEGQLYIPGTKDELDLIVLRAAGTLPIVRLEENSATISSVKESMQISNWVHFACHGVQDPDPTQSALLLEGSSRLTLSNIIQLSLPHADLAFLSACQTATGAKELQEESVHLAAGMLLAGYRSVVATMWTIMDGDAPKVAGDVYEHLFKTSPPDATNAAEALHLAVRNLRENSDGKKSFFHWVPFIHVGV
ncbi:CHAT domain-containing protein [Mycena crocata]|nr:CHAT domain-containing protein [Mycena crocata]